MQKKLRLLTVALLIFAGTAAGQDYVPDELAGWQDWVLKDYDYRSCPFYFDRGATARGDFVCAWPGRLRVEVTPSGGRFTQQWTVAGEAQWVVLPGNVEHWPDRVTVDGRRIEVVARNSLPGIRLEPGTYSVAGRFAWDERPGVLALPRSSALLSLTVDGRAVERPDITERGVFLGERQRDTRAVDSVRLVVYRLIADDVPTRLMTQLQIDVSGSVREELFGPVLPDGFTPLSLQSELPAKLEADGNLRIQVRPGRWVVRLSARAGGVANEVGAPQGGVNMPAEEIWSYRASDRFRATAAEGLPPVDPAQVEVPGPWQNLPAFRAGAGETLSIVERSRGIVSASNELWLARVIWLDFSGEGFVVEDTIAGQMRTDWRLDMGGSYTLLSAAEDEESLLITKGDGEGETGIEVRQTDVAIDALGRINTRGGMAVTGWDSRFTNVQAVLNLPPGNKLLTAPGVDRAHGSWTGQWQLLDFFLVLIITIAVWRLFNPVSGVIALLAITLSFHEFLAPTWLWLNLLVAIALLRVTPDGKLRRWVRSYQLLSAALLVIAIVPFIAGQLRDAIYPQLESQYTTMGLFAPGAAAPTADELLMQQDARVRTAAMKVAPESAPMDSALEEIVVTGAQRTQAFSRYAPNAVVQAGQGIPSWRWNRYALEWNGPVDAEQSMRLVILPRWLVSALRFVEVALLLLFAGILAAEIANRQWQLPGGLKLGRTPAVSVLAVGVCASLLFAAAPAEADTPSQELLEQLELRLLEPPDCVPRCAEIVAADVDVSGETIAMMLSVHAHESVAVPLPGSLRGWYPQATAVDGSSDVRVFRDRSMQLWLFVTPGIHDVTLRGAIPAADSLEIPFASPPRVITVDADGWFVAGVKDRRLLSGSLQLTRLQVEEGGETVRWESSRFPPFVQVERTVELDLDWRVRTTVNRIAPLQGALTLELPLLEGENIVSGDFTVRDGTVLVSMNPQQRSVSWTSNLPRQSPLTLTAGDGAAWTERWRVAVGNIWNVEFAGVPESNTGAAVDAVRIAEFDPRAGESLTLTAMRPEAAAGDTLAFDAVRLQLSQGDRSVDASLSLNYRSTRGAQHIVRLPDDIEIRTVIIDGAEQTLRAEAGELTLPILPGEHNVSITWRGSDAATSRVATPHIDLGAPASNIDLAITLPQDRWILGTNGPKLGPAVLYWSELVALVLFALVLGRIGLTPLKTWHWLLLGLGFSTFNWVMLAVVAAWLLACGAREKINVDDLSWWRFDLVQLAIGGLTVVALLGIIAALPQGLLGTPDMHIAGHGSFGNTLKWFADRSDSALPIASAFTVPMWVYKTLILAWALWLSFALLRWLPWVWQCFSSDGFWRKRVKQ
ncbi:MAG: hypothetical protein QNJ14_15135 [Woeseiaceae bacterium]|nr:hypothetical protein [Woeseiaceae bacterium]